MPWEARTLAPVAKPFIDPYLPTSGNFGYTIGKSIAFAYLPAELARGQGFEIEAFGEVSAATRHDGPLYDPENKRLKA